MNTQHDRTLRTARDWAAALDADDFELARSFLARQCVYRSPVGVLTGPERILDSYQSNSQWARRVFDSIRWESQCDLEPTGTVLITFIDITDHRGQQHEYRCQQRVRLDSAGKIDRIEHLPIEEEEHRLAEFLTRVGVSRGETG